MIIDTAVDVTPSLGALKAAMPPGSTIIRYLNPLNPAGEKCVKAAEAKAIAEAGFRLGLVCEGFGAPTHRDSLGGVCAAAGARDGRWCRQYIAGLGPKPGLCVFFAMDWDAVKAQIANLVIPHFQAVHPFFADGVYRVGVYGSGDVCAAVVGADLAALPWLSQSTGWSGFAAFKPKAAMVQGPSTTVAGVSCDTDEAQGDVGDYVPDFEPLEA